jgi:hypothetical protein
MKYENINEEIIKFNYFDTTHNYIKVYNNQNSKFFNFNYHKIYKKI